MTSWTHCFGPVVAGTSSWEPRIGQSVHNTVGNKKKRERCVP